MGVVDQHAPDTQAPLQTHTLFYNAHTGVSGAPAGKPKTKTAAPVRVASGVPVSDTALLANVHAVLKTMEDPSSGAPAAAAAAAGHDDAASAGADTKAAATAGPATATTAPVTSPPSQASKPKNRVCVAIGRCR